jgi:ketosteroid isomerase-like protein
MMTSDSHYAGVMRAFSSYSLAIDRREWGRVAEAFTEDAVWELADGTRFQGLSRIRERMISGAENGPAKPLHVAFNVCLTVEGDAGVADSNWLYYGEQNGQPWGLLSFGDYEDRLVRTPAGWRLKYRRIVRHLEY